VKAAIRNVVEARSAPASLELDAIARDLAATVAGSTNADRSLLLGIAAVGLMTLQQVGAVRFRESSTLIAQPTGLLSKIPEQIVAARRHDDGQGIFGMFRGVRAEYSVRFDERRDAARFRIIKGQHLTTASGLDRRDYSTEPRRCQEGPIPIRCKSGACGSCWVGILGGADKLSPVEPLEARAMNVFGYISTAAPRPLIRLACQATASGNITIVIPPWQGIFGKLNPVAPASNRLGGVRL
jgi:ferredoxin